MNSIERRIEKLEQVASGGEIRTFEEFWRELALYKESLDRGEAASFTRPVNANLLRALLQGVRECEQDLERRLARGESDARLKEDLQLMRDIRQELEQILNAS
jgi:hypothetical protein